MTKEPQHQFLFSPKLPKVAGMSAIVSSVIFIVIIVTGFGGMPSTDKIYTMFLTLTIPMFISSIIAVIHNNPSRAKGSLLWANVLMVINVLFSIILLSWIYILVGIVILPTLYLSYHALSK